VTAGVVRKTEFKAPKNPNKWGKTLAPWFNDDCRAARGKLSAARREFDRGHQNILEAVRLYKKTCETARLEFAKKVPDMLKY
jgi:hypothetical protein